MCLHITELPCLSIYSSLLAARLRTPKLGCLSVRAILFSSKPETVELTVATKSLRPQPTLDYCVHVWRYNYNRHSTRAYYWIGKGGV